MIDVRAMRAELEAEEGRRRFVYTDTTGNRTIGVGWNLDANGLPEDVLDELGPEWKIEDGLPPWAIDRLLEISIDRAVETCGALCPRWGELDEDRRRVLVQLAFNLGPVRLVRFRRFWAAISRYLDSRDADELDRAATELLGSLAARQAPARYGRLAYRMSATRNGRPDPSI